MRQASEYRDFTEEERRAYTARAAANVDKRRAVARAAGRRMCGEPARVGEIDGRPRHDCEECARVASLKGKAKRERRAA